MKIVHVVSELYPYVKTGGLADAVGALGPTLAEAGHTVSVFLPGYRSALEHPDMMRAERCLRLKVEMGDQFYSGEVRRISPRKNLTIYVVCRDEWFDRRGIYGNGERDYEDNFHRYVFFQKAVVETVRLLDMSADVVHCHDWQTGLLPLLLRSAERRLGEWLAGTTVFTIHNIAFQGLFPMRSFYRTNLPGEFRGIDGVEFYGQISMMKGGIQFSDYVTTVSPSYAREIQTPAFGCGLEGVIALRSDRLFGFLNGIDTAVWNPATDALIPAKYDAGDLAGKAACRAALVAAAGLKPSDTAPIFGMVCRFSEQKGLDLLLANREFFLRQDARLVVLGSGDRRYEEALRALARESPGRVFVANRLDEEMSHLIEAGSDFFLMPSLFEPCGLNQMYSQAYGTPPLASAVGGLRDTVTDVDRDPADGTGLSYPPTASGLKEALDRALALWADRGRYAAAQRNGMRRDFSWKTAAGAYERFYESTL